MSEQVKTGTAVLTEVSTVLKETSQNCVETYQPTYNICQNEMPSTFKGEGYEVILKEASEVLEKLNRLKLWADEFSVKIDSYVTRINEKDSEYAQKVRTAFDEVQNSSVNFNITW